jgi:hypothetical protein
LMTAVIPMKRTRVIPICFNMVLFLSIIFADDGYRFREYCMARDGCE